MRSLAVLGFGILACLGSAACDASEHSLADNTGAGAAGTTSASTTVTAGTGLGAPVSCTDVSSSAGTLTARYDSTTLTANGGKSYQIQSNWWHMFSAEAEPYSGLSFTVKNPQGASVPSTDGSPMGFPSMFIGQYGGHTTTGSNLPKQVSALTSVPTIFKTNSSAIGLINHNAAYDVWFTAAGAPLSASQSSPGTGGAYLMVWLFKPSDRQPRGTNAGRNAQTVSGAPGTWDVWVDRTDPPCVSYVSATPIDALQFDLNDFIQDAVTKQYGLTSSMYLSIVFGGFEIWGGNDGLSVEQFCAAVD